MTHETWKLDSKVYSAIVRDAQISHGAFRLWHLLRDHAAVQGGALRPCWPERNSIVKQLGCNPISLTKWTAELITTGYLKAERQGKNHHYVYRVLGGTNSGTTKPASRYHSDVFAVPLSTVRGTKSGTATYKEANPLSESKKREGGRTGCTDTPEPSTKRL